MTLIYCLLAVLMLQVSEPSGQSVAATDASAANNESTMPSSAVEKQPILKEAENRLASLANVTTSVLPVQAARDEAPATQPTTLVWARLSKEYIADYVDREVDRKKPARDLVLGITFLGESQTKGETRLILHPNEINAAAEVEFVGTVQSRTVGRKGPAMLQYLADTKFASRKPLSIGESGVVAGPAVVSARTQLTPISISTNLPGLRGQIAGRIARNREANQRPQANRIVAEHTADDIKQSFDARLNSAIAALQTKVQIHIAQLKLEQGLPPESRVVMKSRSTPTHIEVAFCDSGANHDWSTDDFDVAGNPDISIRVHRSVLARALGDAELRERFAPGLGSALVGLISTNESPTSNSLKVAPSQWSMHGDWLTLEFADVSQPQPTVAVASAQADEVSH